MANYWAHFGTTKIHSLESLMSTRTEQFGRNIYIFFMLNNAVAVWFGVKKLKLNVFSALHLQLYSTVPCFIQKRMFFMGQKSSSGSHHQWSMQHDAHKTPILAPSQLLHRDSNINCGSQDGMTSFIKSSDKVFTSIFSSCVDRQHVWVTELVMRLSLFSI